MAKKATKAPENAIATALTQPLPLFGPPKDEDLLSTGSSMLNLAITGKMYGGLAAGHYYWFVGDSSSGKTFLTLTCLAEAANKPRFDKYKFIHDNVERGALMDFARFFGAKMAARLQPPKVVGGVPTCSRTVEDFYYTAYDLFMAGPCIYVLDSMDALSSQGEVKAFSTNKTRAAKGEDDKGSYGDGKAKKNSGNIRQLEAALAEHGSILIIISQTRDDIDAGLFTSDPRTASGGRALKFYAAASIWSKVRNKIQREVSGKKLQIGINVELAIKKNRHTGKEWTVNVPLYWSTGLDDIGGMVSYLIEWGHWKKNQQGVVNAHELGVVGYTEDVVQAIETNGFEEDLRSIVADVWAEFQAACHVQRKPRYE